MCCKFFASFCMIWVDPVRRTSCLCRVSSVVVADLVLVGGGRAVAERGVQPASVEEHLDVVEHGSARVRTGRECLAVDAFEFEGREEALGDGVVPALARSRQ